MEANRVKFVLWLLLLAGSVGIVHAQNPQPGADGLGDSRFPLAGNGGYDVQHYTLDLTWDAATGDIFGTATIEALATQALSAFNLDFRGLSIIGITVDDTPATFARAEPELTIQPAQPLLDGDPFTVVVAYSGRPQPLRDPAAPIAIGWITYDEGVYVVSEPLGAATWYPVNDHPLDRATYTFRITVPQPYVVAANGLLQETIDSGATTTYVWEASDPLASYLATVNIGQFDVQTDTGPDGLPIRNYFPPDLDAGALAGFDRTAEMIAFFSDLFGPYPFEAYGVVVVSADFPAALETQTLSVFGPLSLGEVTVAHELAHQWFGDSVALADFGDMWLNEGFASYAEVLWLGHVLEFDIDDLAFLEGFYDTVRELPPPGDPPADDLFHPGVYQRGAFTLHALRLRVGAKTFFEIIQTYYEQFRDRNATTADFIALAEEISGEDLDALFDTLLYADQLPPLSELGLDE